MLDVTYINSVSQISHRITNPLSPRVMKNILDNDKNLNVIYSDAYIKTRIFYKRCRDQGIVFASDMSKNKILFNEFFKYITNDISTEYALITVGSDTDLFFVSHVLNSGKKVIIGGPITKIYTIDQIRQLLSNYCKEYLHNLIIVRPYLGVNTDVHQIILDWKDINDQVFEYNNILEVNEDYLLKHVDKLDEIGFKIRGVQTLLNTTCSWSKCTFCTYANQFKTDFTKQMDIDKYIEHTLELCRKYKTKIVDIADPIILFNKNNMKIIKAFKKEGLFLIGFSSVGAMLNKKYFDNIINHIDMVRIGAETFDDFGLKQLKKGYTYEDIVTIFDRYIEYKQKYSRSNGILLHLMLNLPAYDRTSIIQGYNNIVKQTLKLYEYDVPIHLRSSDLFISPYVPLIMDNPFIVPDQKPGTTLFPTYKRYDYKGDELPVDEKLLNRNIYQFVTNQLEGQHNFLGLKDTKQFHELFNIKGYQHV